MLRSKSGGTGSAEERGDASWWDREAVRSESEEYIVMTPTKAKIAPLEIWESKEFDVVNNRSSFIDPNRVEDHLRCTAWFAVTSVLVSTLLLSRSDKGEDTTRTDCTEVLTEDRLAS